MNHNELRDQMMYQGMVGGSTQGNSPLRSIGNRVEVELTAEQIRSALLKRADKLRANLSHVDEWRAELKRIEDMMRAYDAPLIGSVEAE